MKIFDKIKSIFIRKKEISIEDAVFRRMNIPGVGKVETFSQLLPLFMLEDGMGLKEEEIDILVGVLPASLRGRVKLWVGVFLAWFFCKMIIEKHGEVCLKETFDMAHKILPAIKDRETNELMRHALETYSYWFPIFNSCEEQCIQLGDDSIVLELIANAMMDKGPDGELLVVDRKDVIENIKGVLNYALSIKNEAYTWAVHVASPIEDA